MPTRPATNSPSGVQTPPFPARVAPRPEGMTPSWAAEPGPRLQPTPEAIAKERNGGRWRGHVLVAEPEHPIARMVQQMLSNDHDVEFETQPDEFLRRIERCDQFDVIFCDVRMLERIGLERWAKLSAEHPGHAARIVFVTDDRMCETARVALASMSNLCIRKPFNLDGMRALVWRRTRERLFGGRPCRA